MSTLEVGLAIAVFVLFVLIVLLLIDMRRVKRTVEVLKGYRQSDSGYNRDRFNNLNDVLHILEGKIKTAIEGVDDCKQRITAEFGFRSEAEKKLSHMIEELEKFTKHHADAEAVSENLNREREIRNSVDSDLQEQVTAILNHMQAVLVEPANNTKYKVLSFAEQVKRKK